MRCKDWAWLGVVVSLLACGCKTNWPKVSTLDDGSQIYRFENGKSCVKTPYALKNTDAEGALKIREIFETTFSYEKKYEQIKSLGKEFDQLDAAFFSICHDHAEGRIDDDTYRTLRNDYEKIRQEFMKKGIGEEASVSPSVPSIDVPGGVIKIPGGYRVEIHVTLTHEYSASIEFSLPRTVVKEQRIGRPDQTDAAFVEVLGDRNPNPTGHTSASFETPSGEGSYRLDFTTTWFDEKGIGLDHISSRNAISIQVVNSGSNGRINLGNLWGSTKAHVLWYPAPAS